MCFVYSLSRLRERAGVRAMGVQPIQDGVEHTDPFGQDLTIVETQHLKAKVMKREGAALVSFCCFWFEMLAAIELDHQTGFNASDVCEERADGVLAAELVSGETAVAENAPQCLLSPCRFLAQNSGELGGHGGIW